MLGRGGERNLATGEVAGDDPLAPFGPRRRRPGAPRSTPTATVADLMVNARYDPERDEVAAFEEQVGSHGGLGGPQTHPFLLYPAALSPPDAPIFTSVAMHRVLKTWLAEVGQPVASRGWRVRSRSRAGRRGDRGRAVGLVGRGAADGTLRRMRSRPLVIRNGLVIDGTGAPGRPRRRRHPSTASSPRSAPASTPRRPT